MSCDVPERFQNSPPTTGLQLLPRNCVAVTVVTANNNLGRSANHATAEPIDQRAAYVGVAYPWALQCPQHEEIEPFWAAEHCICVWTALAVHSVALVLYSSLAYVHTAFAAPQADASDSLSDMSKR